MLAGIQLGNAGWRPGWLRTLVEGAEAFHDVVTIDGMCITTAGFAARYLNEQIVGSAASLDEPPAPRARAELIERLAIVDAARRVGSTWVVRDRDGMPTAAAETADIFPAPPDDPAHRWARSNGVAAGQTWSEAADRAYFEAVERDRILRSWFGEVMPRRIDSPSWLQESLARTYDVESYEFGVTNGSEPPVAGVFAFPRCREHPLVYGFGCAGVLERALLSAARECVQRLGFLWGEELPKGAVVATPTADFHQEHFLLSDNQKSLRRWLAGEHSPLRGVLRAQPMPEEPRFVDLTPSDDESALFVAKAIVPNLVPLAFGRGHPHLLRPIPEAASVHPIV